jgi:tetratricopeptide (TPR) repeat protein
LTWFAILLSGQYLPTDLELNPSIDLKFMTWCPEKKAIGVGLLLLFILASLNVFHDGRADRRLKKLSEIPSMEEAQQIAEAYPFRPDITAAYTTLTLQYYVSRKIVPEKEVLIAIEKDLFTSLRYHYIPLLALKRYSDLFHMVSDDNRALQIMEYAAARFPSHLPTNLLVAQQYEAQGRLVEAQKFYKLCVNLDPASPELRKKLAQLYKKGGKENEFREQLRYLILLDPTAKLD